MRILMLNNEYPPLGGGTGTINEMLIGYLAGLPNMEIDLITSNSELGDRKEAILPNVRIFRLSVGNNCIHHSSNRELLIYALRASILSFRLARQQHYDLCFAWCTVPAGAVAFLLKLLCGLSYIVRVSGPDIPGFESRYRYLYPILTPSIRRIWRSAKSVISKCDHENQMIRKVCPDVNLQTIPNGVDIARFETVGERESHESLRLLCVGRLIERKGQRQIFVAVKRCLEEGTRLSLNLVGTGDSERNYRELVRELGIENAVHFLGYVARDLLPNHYQLADVFVLASANEGMSVAILEAMSAGLPLLVSKHGAPQTVVSEGENALVFPLHDVDTLVRHLKTLSQDVQLRKRLGAGSKKLVRGFSATTMGENYWNILSAIHDGPTI